eukprot:7388344-Prymnesium_polylepis.1
MDRAPANVCANGTGSNAEVTGDGPAVGDTGAAPVHSMEMTSSQAAGTSSDRHAPYHARGAAEVSTQSECFSVPELKERALRMFTNDVSEAPRASCSSTVMSEVTAQLVINVTAAIEALMGTPRKPGSHRAEMVRCCGDLDKEEARGWLVADCVGRPLLHRNDDRSQNDPRDVGKRVLERAGKAKADIAAAKEAAREAVRAAKRAAAKDPSKQQSAADAEQQREQAVAAACAELIDLDFPDITVGRQRPEEFWSRREVQEADAVAAAAAAEATIACAEKLRAEARKVRAFDEMLRDDAPEGAGDKWSEAASAYREASAASREAAAAAAAAAAEAAAARAASQARGVDVRPGNRSKRRREDEAVAHSEVSAVLTDMINAVAAFEFAEPYYVSLEQWHFLEEEVRWAREECPGCSEEKAQKMRRVWMEHFEERAEACEMRCRNLGWQYEMLATRQEIEFARRLQDLDDPCDDVPDPDSELDEFEYAAAKEIYDARLNELALPLMRAEYIVAERQLARMPWQSSLRMRMQDEGDRRL